MKQVDVSLWELTKEELQILSKKKPGEHILVYDSAFERYRIVSVQTAAKEKSRKRLAPQPDGKPYYFAFEDPTT